MLTFVIVFIQSQTSRLLHKGKPKENSNCRDRGKPHLGKTQHLIITPLQGYIVRQTIVPQTAMQAVVHGHTSNVLYNY